MKKRSRQIDPEIRLAKATRRGEPSSYRPDLGPCLIYTGADNGNGYGQFRFNGRNGYAHRYAWERVHGPIPQGLTVDHLCRVRRCVEVTHMELVDGVENYRRGARAQTMCRNGLHRKTPENTYFHGGRPYCVLCRRQRDRDRLARRRAEMGNPASRSIKFDQSLVRQQITLVRTCEVTIAAAARAIGCHPNYLGRRVWTVVKRDVQARDENQCVRCGTDVGCLDVHHRHPRGIGGARDPHIAYGFANLITLCRFCHSYIESHRAVSYWFGYLVRSGHNPATTPLWLPPNEWSLLTDTGEVVPVRDLPEEIA